jgi:hypothetical protein
MVGDDDFDPLNLDNRVSLNRTRLASHPAIDASAQGREAWDLLSAAAVRTQIQSRAVELGIDGPGFIEADPVVLLQGCFESQSPAVRTAAGNLAARLGEVVAYLLMTLTRSGSDRQATRFRHAYLDHWRKVQRVHLGGGIMRGALGRHMSDSCLEVLAREAIADPTVALAASPHLLPLLGAAYSAEPEDAASALVFDFGNSNVKHGIAHYEWGTVTRLAVRGQVRTQGLPDEIAGTSHPADARRIADFMAGVIASDWREAVAAGEAPSAHIVASIACYLRDGRPLDYDAGYASLRLLSDNAAAYLSQAVSERVGREVRVTLSHDGTTAARVYAGQPHTAVIMLGTWLGVGFAPEDASGLRPLASGFEVTRY